VVYHAYMKLFLFLSFFIFTIGCVQDASTTSSSTTINPDEIKKRPIIKDYRDYENDASSFLLNKLDLNYSFEKPWAMEFIEDTKIVITEKNGKLLLVDLINGDVSTIKHEIPSFQHGQGGLLDVVREKDYLYLSFTIMNEEKKYTTAIGRGKFTSPFNELNDFEIIFTAQPYYNDGKHFGSRVIIKDNQIYASIGERGQGFAAQELDSHTGSIVRINLDGSVPNNPYQEYADALPEIFMIGVRNPQGMALSEKNEIFISNHGAKGGDFIGLVNAKKNYGWNKIGWGGTNYSGTKIGAGESFSNKFEMPLLSWVPSIAPSDIIFYKGNEFPDWEGDLLVTSLKFKMLLRLKMENGKIIDEFIILKDEIGRIRDVDINSQGEIFLISDENNSELWKLNSLN